MVFQIGPALLDVCVLSILAKQDAYGYMLTQQVQDIFAISENTVYPVLRRLLNDGYVQTYNQPYQGRNRKYYTITPLGRSRLEEIGAEWDGYKNKVDQMLGRENPAEQEVES